MRYRVHVSPPAAAAFNKLSPDVRTMIYPHLTALADDPYPPSSKPLTGNLKGWRSLRVGDYRIGYGVVRAKGLIRVRMVADRRDFHGIMARLADEPLE